MATAQLLGLQVGELCRLVPGGQLVFRLCLNDNLWEEIMQEDPELGGLGGKGGRGQLPAVVWVLVAGL